jgi:D-3-phosphoglycerate dehydrogenase
MKVAVAARSFARNPVLRGELLARYPDAAFSDSPTLLDGDRLIALLRRHDAAVIGLERVDESILKALPELRVISKYGVGLDGLDLDAIARHKIRLGWTGGVNKRSVAELTVMFAIALLHRVPETAFSLRDGQWNKLVGRQLSNRSVGIIGCGHVGKDLVGLLAPYHCRILVNDIVDYADFYRAHQITAVSLDDLLAESEIVTLHVPLDRSTRGMIGAGQIARMQKGSVLINAARGGLVDEAALASALTSGHLAGAAADVYQAEPAASPALLALPTVLGTPHIGGSSEEAQLAMGRAAIAGLTENQLVTADWPSTMSPT